MGLTQQRPGPLTTVGLPIWVQVAAGKNLPRLTQVDGGALSDKHGSAQFPGTWGDGGGQMCSGQHLGLPTHNSKDRERCAQGNTWAAHPVSHLILCFQHWFSGTEQEAPSARTYVS